MASIASGYVCAFVVFSGVDLVWLTLMGNRFYRPILGDILLPEANLKAAAAFYLLYPIGLTIFAVAPALKTGEVKSAAVMGALFGLFAYATYDLTNQATVRNWSLTLTLVDVAWGTLLSGFAAVIAAVVSARIG